jgi:hypothetical protein
MHKLQYACILKLTSRPVREPCSGIQACVPYGLRPMHDTQQCLDCWGHILLKCSVWSTQEIRLESPILGIQNQSENQTCYRESKVEAGDWVADRGAERDLTSKQTGAIQTVRRIIMFAGILEALIFLFGIDGRGLRVQTSQSNEWALENGTVSSLHRVFACQRNPLAIFSPRIASS